MAFVLRLRARGVADVALLRALETTPRHLFVPHFFTDLAWRDIALPIACGQTMPEPMQVARMIEALRLSPHHRVLEIGTGSGYTSAVLSRLCREVVSVERFGSLTSEAGARLHRIGARNIQLLHGDGLALAEAGGAFDRVLVDGSLIEIPQCLRLRLADGGAVVHARPAGAGHVLARTRFDAAGKPTQTLMGACRAVELVAGVSHTL